MRCTAMLKVYVNSCRKREARCFFSNDPLFFFSKLVLFDSRVRDNSRCVVKILRRETDTERVDTRDEKSIASTEPHPSLVLPARRKA